MNDDFESRLRASLRRHAQDAPPADPVAERVLRELHTRPAAVRRRREWRAWTLPLAAAAAVVVVAGAVVGLTQLGRAPNPAATHLAGPDTTRTSSPTAPATTLSAPTGSTGPDSHSTAPVVPGDLHGVRILDATFVGPADGWLLASADCIGRPGTCTAMLHTTDGGAHWTSMKPPPANVLGVNGCAAPCVAHIRFANARTGYAYGDGFDSSGAFSGAFFMTTDGGRTWQQQDGVSAVALETLDGNVIRLTATHPACAGFGCQYEVETSAIGSTTWHRRPIAPYISTSVGASLVRGGPDAYVLVRPHLSGNAPAELYRSADDGQTWAHSDGTAREPAGAPCPATGGARVVASAVAAGADGRVSLICRRLDEANRSFLAVSTDHGAQFTASAGTIPGADAALLAGDPATVLLAAGGSHVYRSTDAGASWRPVPGVSGTVSWLGFESRTVGRIVADGGRTIWTTRDGGATWTPLTFG